MLETLAVVIDNMAQTPALDLVNTDMGKVCDFEVLELIIYQVNLKNFVHLVHDLRKELRFYHVDEGNVHILIAALLSKGNLCTLK